MPSADAIVVEKPLSYNGGDPAMVQVDSIGADGFWARAQKWRYLDGTHAPEVASYLAMERGPHQPRLLRILRAIRSPRVFAISMALASK